MTGDGVTAAELVLGLAVGVGSALCAVVVVLLRRRIPASQDEIWFLLVVTRVRRGRRLYAEVFYGAGPLPVWGSLVVSRRSRPGLLALRRLSDRLAVLTAGCLLLVVSLLAPDPVLVGTCALAVAGLALAWPADNAYGVWARAGAALAILPMTAAGLGVPAWLVGPLAGGSGLALAGAVFAKHPVGAAAAVTVLPGWLLTVGPAAAAAVAATAGVGAVAVLTLLRTRGELRGFVRRTLTDKGTYLATGRLSFLGAAARLVRERPPGWWVDLAAYVVVAAAAPAALVTVFTGSPAAATSVALAATVLAGVVPRADPEHVRPLVSGAVVVLLVALHPVPTTALVVAAVVSGMGLAAVLASFRRHPRTAGSNWLAGVPAVRPVGPEELEAGRLIRRTAGRRVLVLRSHAAQWYLALGLVNPTAYDYPLASTFGSRGQQDVADRLGRHDIEWCLFEPVHAGPLSPSLLEDTVRSRMEPVLSTVLGDLYRARGE